jgi:hypothetical protein
MYGPPGRGMKTLYPKTDPGNAIISTGSKKMLIQRFRICFHGEFFRFYLPKTLNPGKEMPNPGIP